MYKQLEAINTRPAPFEFYTAAELWTNEHTSKQMLTFHLDKSFGLASRQGAFIEKSVTWITHYFQIGSGTEIIDFGCGPGLYTSRFAKTGADVSGIDFSLRSIEYARNEAKKADQDINYIHQDYLEFETDEQFDLITMIFCDFCALSPQQRKKILGIFHNILKPGGSILLDVHSLNVFNKKEEGLQYEPNLHNGFWSANPYHGFLNSFKYADEKVILDKYTLIEADRTRTVYNWLQCFSPESLKQEFKQNGLRVKDKFSDVSGQPYRPESDDFAVIAEKCI